MDCGELTVGGFLESDERVVGAGERLEDFIEFSLRDQLLSGLGVLDDEHQRQGDRGDHGLEDGLPSGCEAERDAVQQPQQVRGLAASRPPLDGRTPGPGGAAVGYPADGHCQGRRCWSSQQ